MEKLALLMKTVWSGSKPIRKLVATNLTEHECQLAEKIATERMKTLDPKVDVSYIRITMGKFKEFLIESNNEWMLRENVTNFLSVGPFIGRALSELLNTANTTLPHEFALFAEKSGIKDSLSERFTQIASQQQDNVNIAVAAAKYLAEINKSKDFNRLPN